MAKHSGINSTGNYSAAGCVKKEIRSTCNYDYEYSPDSIIRAIEHKAEIISNRNNGSFQACELLLDIEMYEAMYLDREQRELIRLRYVDGLELGEIAKKKHCNRCTIARQLAGIRKDITDGLESEEL
ncbi:ECF-type sigma factor [Anaerovibrio sp. JC8]|uniref:ECF-type sigma factor n=1 Tax=Anaerovibrio sp. JC8 TaxID=1240085 RepID=UPI000A120A7B|nr:ECF-type sigma factor [Anaerovibrio sp. JC8]